MHFLLASLLLRTTTRKQLTQIISDSATTRKGSASFLFCIYTDGVKRLSISTSKYQRFVPALRAAPEERMYESWKSHHLGEKMFPSMSKGYARPSYVIFCPTWKIQFDLLQ